jgi:hypothetical protein
MINSISNHEKNKNGRGEDDLILTDVLGLGF